MGAALMVVVCARHLSVPLIPIGHLCKFFNNVEDTTDSELQYSNMIRRFTCLLSSFIVIDTDIYTYV